MFKETVNLVFWSYLFLMGIYLILQDRVLFNNRQIIIIFGLIIAMNIVVVLIIETLKYLRSSFTYQPRKRFRKLNMRNTFGENQAKVYENNAFGYLESASFVAIVNCLTCWKEIRKNFYNFVLAFFSNGVLQLLIVSFIVFALFTDNFVPAVTVEAIEEFLGSITNRPLS